MAPDKNIGTKRTGIFPGLLFTALFGVAALFFTWKIADYLIDERKGLDYWNELQNSMLITDAADQDKDKVTEAGHSPVIDEQEPAVEDTEIGEPVAETGIPAAIDFDKLHAVSENAVAWIFSPKTKINYVIAQSDDNAYYLRRLLDGGAASGGTLFVDYRCSADFSDWNTVVYGHYMKNGTMFGGLANYRDPAYYEEHPVMYLYIPGKRYTLELIAGYTTDVDDMIYSVPASREERDEILAHAVGKSSFISAVTAGEEDRLVTLSTCSYAYDNARYVVLGRLVEN